MKRLSVLMFVLMITLVFSSAASAKGHSGGGKGSKGWGLSEKIEHKAMFFKLNQEELGLTDDQIDKIKALKAQAKKIKIQKSAEKDVLGVDFKTLTYAYPVDEKALNQIVEKKLTVKKEMARELINIYAQMRNMLTEEQNDKMKEIWIAQKKGSGGGHASGACPHCGKDCSSGQCKFKS